MLAPRWGWGGWSQTLGGVARRALESIHVGKGPPPAPPPTPPPPPLRHPRVGSRPMTPKPRNHTPRGSRQRAASTAPAWSPNPVLNPRSPAAVFSFLSEMGMTQVGAIWDPLGQSAYPALYCPLQFPFFGLKLALGGML